MKATSSLIGRSFMIQASLLLCALAVPGTILGSGFALYEPTTVSHAMGGALVGKAMDASANFNNPATLTDLTNIQITVGFVTEHPRCSVDAHKNGGMYQTNQMDPGFFWLPHLQLAVPLPYDFAFGLGMSAEYGLGSQYSDGWLMNFSSVDTTIQGFVINPNIAYKITDDWSVGVGLRWLFFDFEQYSYPQVTKTLGADSGSYAGTYDLGTYGNRLYGKNDFRDIGWQIGTKYDITKTLSVGLVYKSEITDIAVRGKTCNQVVSYNSKGIGALAVPSGLSSLKSDLSNPDPSYDALRRQYMMGGAAAQQYIQQKYISGADQVIRQTVANGALSRTGRAEADISLPQSITGGINWDALPTWHLGAAVSWTEWSVLDAINFQLEGGDKTTQLDWQDTWRGSIGSCWDFAEDWKWMVSYTYDMDATTWTQASTMIPSADRHILATGFAWNVWGGLEIAISYSCIFMAGGDINMSDSLGNRYQLETNWGYCHAAGASITYRF